MSVGSAVVRAGRGIGEDPFYRLRVGEYRTEFAVRGWAPPDPRAGGRKPEQYLPL